MRNPNTTTTHQLQGRTKQFAIDVIRFVEQLPRTDTARVLGRQLLRSATSVGANYRAACRARSRADSIAKMGVVEEEADESGFWLDLIVEAKAATHSEVLPLSKEAGEITAVAVASIKSARKR